MTLDTDRLLRETFVVRAEHHPSLGSTNDRAAECGRQAAAEMPLLVAADRQTAGRGRGANRWWTGPGALAFSLLVDGPTVGAIDGPAPLVALAAAVAVVDAVAPLLPGHAVGIRWPNDVLVDEKKLAGILIEALPNRRHVVGIGLNANNTLADAPAELQSTAVTLCDLAGRRFDPTETLVGLLKCLQNQFQRLRDDPRSVAARADALCRQRGRMATLQCERRSVAGRCEGIADDGGIRLRTSAGVETFYSGSLRETSTP